MEVFAIEHFSPDCDGELFECGTAVDPNIALPIGRFLHTVNRHAADPAMTVGRITVTYSQLLQLGRTVAEHLRSLPDYLPGCRVIVLAPNSIEYVAAMLGVWLADAVFVPQTHKVEGERLSRLIETTDAIAVLSTPRVLRVRKDLSSYAVSTISGNMASHSDFSMPSVMATEDSLAAIFFTSGSSGKPKGVMLTHANLAANAQSIQSYLRIDHTERPLCVLPFHHAFGNSILQSHLLAGAHLVLDGQTLFPETLLDAIEKHHCTSLSGVPDLFTSLMERSSLGTRSLPSLRYCSVAGGALRRPLALRIQQLIHPSQFVVMYGQTEATARLAWLANDELLNVDDGCIGQAIPGVTLAIVDEQGSPVPPGETGELIAQGPNIMAGYWCDPTATAERLRDGWLYTGDLASQDQAGRIVIRGRRSSFVKIAGYRVMPSDLEEFAARELPVYQAVAVSFESTTVGTRLALYLRPSETAGDDLISRSIAICRAKLPRHLVPAIVKTVDHFPLTAACKIDRPLLTKWAHEASLQQRNRA